MTCACAVASFVLLAAHVAGAASNGDALVRPGIGIAKLRLGMTLLQARRALGRQLVPVLPEVVRDGVVFREYRTRDARGGTKVPATLSRR